MIISEFCKIANISPSKDIGVQNSKDMDIKDKDFIVVMSNALKPDDLTTLGLSQKALDTCNLLGIYTLQGLHTYKQLFSKGITDELHTLDLI